MLQTNEYDESTVDMFAGVNIRIHNGPLCIKCGWATCWHCNKLENIPECKGDIK